MHTRLPRALAALGVALLLSSIEAEGKMLLLLLWQVTLKNSRKEKTHLFCFCCLLCFLCTSPVISLLQRNALLLRCVRFQAFRSSSYILLPLFCTVLCGLLALACSVLSTLPSTLPPSRRTSPLDRATAASSSTKRILEGWVPGTSEYGHPHRISS